MANDIHAPIYKQLRERFDELSCGYPTTESGVEFAILKKLYTEQDAALFLHLTQKPETPESVATRIGREPLHVASELHSMKERGLVFSVQWEGVTCYAAIGFVPGIWEFQLGRLDAEMAAQYDQYFEEAFLEHSVEHSFETGGLMRTVPVNQSLETLDTLMPVATYDMAREIIKSKKFIAVADCICRKQNKSIDKGCGKPLETCIQFDAMGQHMVDLGAARPIEVEEALQIMADCEKAGLVAMAGVSTSPLAICSCCGDCCVILRALKKLAKPARSVISNFLVSIDAGSCIACGVCLERCQMGAISINSDNVAEVNLDRCIGCGLCVTTCPGECIHLVQKEEAERQAPPETYEAFLGTIAAARGKNPI
jgi:NAD-dependent dihydropyrimidine dehydrogenase PreA subunit